MLLPVDAYTWYTINTAAKQQLLLYRVGCLILAATAAAVCSFFCFAKTIFGNYLLITSIYLVESVCCVYSSDSIGRTHFKSFLPHILSVNWRISVEQTPCVMSPFRGVGVGF